MHLADLASQEGLVWARVESGDLDLGASADRERGAAAGGPGRRRRSSGVPASCCWWTATARPTWSGPGGRPLLSGRRVTREEPRVRDGGPPPGQDEFREVALRRRARAGAGGHAAGGRRALRSAAPAEEPRAARAQRAAHALAALRRRVAVVRRRAAAAEPAALAHGARARCGASTTRWRAPPRATCTCGSRSTSRDEVGSMAESFNRMVGELEASRQQIEGVSRNLESMVEARTGRAARLARRACSGSRTTWPR